MEQDGESLSFEELLGVVRRRAALVALCVVALVAAAIGFSKLQAPTYTATAAVDFEDSPLSQQIAGLPTNTGNLLVQQAGDLQLVQLGDMAAKTAVSLGLSERAVRMGLTIKGLGESSAVAVSASARSPRLAAAIANGYVAQFVRERQAANRAYFAGALHLVERQIAALPARQRFGPSAIALQNRAQDLRFLADLGYGDVHVAQQALAPSSPSAPNVSRNALLGAFLGLVIGLGLALLLERRASRRILRDERDVVALYGRELLGEAALQQAPPAQAPSPGKPDTFALIEARMRTFNAGGSQVILIAATSEADGADAVAAGLVAAGVRAGLKVAAIEAEPGGSALAARFGLDLPLPAERSAAPLPVRVPIAGGFATVDGLLAGSGATPASLGAVLDRARQAYDLTVVHTAPVACAADALRALAHVDGALVLVRLGKTRRVPAEALAATLRAAEKPVLGVLAVSGSGELLRGDLPPRSPAAVAADRPHGHNGAPAGAELVAHGDPA